MWRWGIHFQPGNHRAKELHRLGLWRKGGNLVAVTVKLVIGLELVDVEKALGVRTTPGEAGFLASGVDTTRTTGVAKVGPIHRNQSPTKVVRGRRKERKDEAVVAKGTAHG